MNWYTDWFNSTYYHVLYKNRDVKEAQSFIDNLISKLQLRKTSNLIDIACGKGRHASYFNSKGMNVLGIDLSPKSIASAKQNENKNLQFEVHDMREIFRENYFDIATNLFTSFGYFENQKEEQTVINAMAGNLKKEGILILDFMNVKKILLNLVSSEKKTVDNIIFDIKRRATKTHIIKDIYVSDNMKEKYFQEKVQIITLADFHIFFNKAGLSIIDVFGSYMLEKFNTSTSDRLILIGKKK